MASTRSRTVSGSERLAVVAVAWASGAVVAGQFLPWRTAALAGWDLGACVLLAWVWATAGRFTAGETRELATREDGSRVATSLALLTASVASLLGAGGAALDASSARAAERTASLMIGGVTVFLSWGVVQTVFALRYAHEYYRSPLGGIDFGDPDSDPDYQDFAYLALTIGMTFQVSDTTIRDRVIRRTATRHALLAYLFGAVILAVMVNVIAGLVR